MIKKIILFWLAVCIVQGIVLAQPDRGSQLPWDRWQQRVKYTMNVMMDVQTNRFTGSQTLADSSITDDGTVVTVSTGQVIQGASGLTLGASGVNGQLVFQNGSNGNTLTLQSGVTTGNLTLTLPTADGSDGQCLKTNGLGTLSFAACTGGAGGGVTSVNSLTGMINVVGTANQVAVSTTGDTIT